MCIQRLLPVSLLLMTAVACQARPPLVPPPAPPPPLRLDFRPPEGRVLVESVKTTRTVARGGARVTEKVVLRPVTRFTKAEGGWLLTQTVPQARLSREGTPVDTRVDDVLERFTLQVRLAADGTFVEVVDAEAALRAVREVVREGPEVAELERFFAPEALVERTRAEWERKYGGLFQRNLQEGQRAWTVERLPVGEGEAVVYVLERMVQGTEPTDYGDALTLALRCLDTVPAGAPEALRAVYAQAGSPALTPGVTCEGEQVVARARFVPVRGSLTVRAKVGEAEWTLAMESKAEKLEEEAAR